MVTLRPARLPEDAPALLRLDTAFTTERILQVRAAADSFTLEELRAEPPVRKAFPLEEELGEERPWDEAFVAELAGEIVGFLAVRHEEWNRRAVIWHLYVDSAARGGGVGRRLIAAAGALARGRGARCLWLEVTSVNYPAIQFYRRVGFRLCGLDTSLYDPAGEAAGETALYFMMETP